MDFPFDIKMYGEGDLNGFVFHVPDQAAFDKYKGTAAFKGIPIDIIEPSMNERIEQKQLEAVREENPVLSKFFKNSLLAEANGKGRVSAAINDGASNIGRMLGAAIDVTTSPSEYGFMESLGQDYKEASVDPRRSFFGQMLHGALRDPLTAISVPLGSPRILGFANPLAKQLSKIGNPLANTVATGFATSGIAEGLRPFATGDDFDAGNALKNVMLGTAIPVGIHGGKATARGAERLVRGNYGKALSRLSELNNVEADALDLLSTPEGRAGLAANFRQEPDIAEKDLLSLGGFSEERFPEYSKWGEFLQREAASTPTVGTGDLAETMLGYGKRKMANGGGLTSDEKAISSSLESDADIFFDPAPKKAEPAPLLLDQYGMAITKEAPKRAARTMNAYQLNDARKRVGALLDDEWKKMAAGRPDEEVKVLKDVYSGLRAKILAIAEENGEKEALDAYAKMAQKLGARDLLWDLAKIGGNKNRAQQNAEKAISNAWNNKNADHRALQEAFKNSDLAFGTNLYNRSRYASHAKNLASPKHPSNKPFEPAGGSKWFNGRGKQELMDNLRGRTVKSAGEKLARIKDLQKATDAMRNGFGWMGYGVPVPESIRLGIAAPLAQEDESPQGRYVFMQ